jgi:hypothetical protein
MSGQTPDKILKDAADRIREEKRPKHRRTVATYINPCFSPPSRPPSPIDRQIEFTRLPPSPIDLNQPESSLGQFQRLVNLQTNESQSELSELDIDQVIGSTVLLGYEESIGRKIQRIEQPIVNPPYEENPLEDTASSLAIGENISPIADTSISPQRTPTPIDYSTPTYTPSSAIISEYLRETWAQDSRSVVERLESYLSPVRELIEESSTSSTKPERPFTPPHLEISSGQFLNFNFNFEENTNPFNF